MLQAGWLFVGLLAVLATGTAVWTNDDGVAIMAGVLGFVTWGVWSFGTLNVRVAEAQVTSTMPELTMLGVVWSLVPAYIALTGPVELVNRARNPSAEDI